VSLKTLCSGTITLAGELTEVNMSGFVLNVQNEAPVKPPPGKSRTANARNGPSQVPSKRLEKAIMKSTTALGKKQS
jgi:hypothetical protein